MSSGRSELVGLSPRVRGNPYASVSVFACVGSIPARAGEPDAAASPPSWLRVYPRACGGTPWQIDSFYYPSFAKGARLPVPYQVHAVGVHDLFGRVA